MAREFKEEERQKTFITSFRGEDLAYLTKQAGELDRIHIRIPGIRLNEDLTTKDIHELLEILQAALNTLNKKEPVK